MNKVLKNLLIIFVLCVIGVGVTLFIINYRSSNTTSKTNNTNRETVVTEKEDVVNQEVVKNEVQEEPANNVTSDSSQVSSESSSTTLNQQEESNSVAVTQQTKSTYIPVTKFVVRIQNSDLYVGDTTSLITTIYPTNATSPDLSYSSSNPSVATVSSDGTVTALSPGECYLTVTVNNLATGQVYVTISSRNNTIYLNDNVEEQKQEQQQQQKP